MTIRNEGIITPITKVTTIVLVNKTSHSLFPHRFSPYCALIAACLKKKLRKLRTCKTSQTIGTGRGKSQQLLIQYILFICFLLLNLFWMALKTSVLIKHSLIRGCLPHLREFYVKGGNNFKYISMDAMVDAPSLHEMILCTLSSSTITLLVESDIIDKFLIFLQTRCILGWEIFLFNFKIKVMRLSCWLFEAQW